MRVLRVAWSRQNQKIENKKRLQETNKKLRAVVDKSYKRVEGSDGPVIASVLRIFLPIQNFLNASYETSSHRGKKTPLSGINNIEL